MTENERRENTDKFAQSCLHELILSNDRIVLANIGCNDGVFEDPFFRHLQMAGEKLCGLYVEPLVEYSEDVQLLRRWCPSLFYFPYAISNEDGHADFTFIPPTVAYRARLESWACGCGSLRLDCPEASEGHYREHFTTTTVSTRTWATFVTEALLGCRGEFDGLERLPIDALNLDVESHESTVLPQVDFAEHGIKWAKIELRHQPADVQGKLLRRFIESDEYVVLGGIHDSYVIDSELFKTVTESYSGLEVAA